jgi:hypothetical protein
MVCYKGITVDDLNKFVLNFNKLSEFIEPSIAIENPKHRWNWRKICSRMNVKVLREIQNKDYLSWHDLSHNIPLENIAANMEWPWIWFFVSTNKHIQLRKNSSSNNRFDPKNIDLSSVPKILINKLAQYWDKLMENSELNYSPSCYLTSCPNQQISNIENCCWNCVRKKYPQISKTL